MYKLLLALVFIFALTDALRWRTKNDDGEDIVRSIKLLRSPLDGNPNVIEVQATKKNLNTGDLDALRFLFTTNWIPRWVVRHFQKDSDSKELFGMRWMVWKIIEYTEGDGSNNGFQPTGADVINSAYHLWIRSWSGLTYKKTEIEGAEYHSLCTNLTAVAPRPDVTFCVHLTSKRIQSLRADPNAIKWSITIANYPYTVSNSRLALKVSFDTKYVVKDLSEAEEGAGATEYDSANEGALELAQDENGQGRGIASWITTVEVAGTNCTPTGSVSRSVVFEGEVQRDIDTLPTGDDDNLEITRTRRISYFSFITDCQPQSVTWDPEFGVATDGVSGLIPSILLLAALLLFFVM